MNRSQLRWGTPGQQFLTYASVLVVLILTVFPFYWMFVTSLKPMREIYNVTANPFYTATPTLGHYRMLLTETPFLQWFAGMERLLGLRILLAQPLKLVSNIIHGFWVLRTAKREGDF